MRAVRGSLTDRLASAARRSGAGRRALALRDELRRRKAPVHWTNPFGVVALACVIVLFVTGFVLMFFYAPSSTQVTYRGSYLPLQGATMSKALESTVNVSFDVRGGLLLRQAHHWAALLLPAAIMLQLLVMFFTGAFRRPRRFSWVLLFGILIIALLGGWSGYALPDDMLSGTGLRIVEGIVLAIPVVGTWLSTLLFGGQFPGDIIEHLYPVHVALVPVLLIVLLALRARTSYLNKPAQFAGEGRTERVIVGLPLWPNHAARSAGTLAVVTAALVMLSAVVTIDPVWLYGPSSPGNASAGSQPDWYTGFLDGALRLVPPGWEFVWLGHTWSLAILVPLFVVGAFLVGVLGYPFFEEWVTGDSSEHHLLVRPRYAATRTAIGVASIVFFGALWGAASADLVATHFRLAVESVVAFYQVAVVVGPPVAFFIARRVCLGLQKPDRGILLHGYETGRIVRMPGGEYVEVHGRVDDHARRRLRTPAVQQPYLARPDERGRLHASDRARAAISRFFFEDQAVPEEEDVTGSSQSAIPPRTDVPR